MSVTLARRITVILTSVNRGGLMLNSPTLDIIRLVTALSCTLITACSGGGGGGGAALSAPSAASAAPAAPTFCSGCVGPPSLGYNFDTGISAGPIAAPAPASFGTAPAQVAVPSGPTFDGSSGSYPANVTFPLISTSLKSASPGMSAAAAQDATLTLISSSANSQNFQLVIPSLNLNTNVHFGENIVSNIDGTTYGFSYVAVGFWEQRSAINEPIQSNTEFSFGYETPGSSMPTTGSGDFSGLASASVFKPASGTIAETSITGRAILSANFSSGQVTGTMTQMKQYDGMDTHPYNFLQWNDVSLNASIAPGSNRFSGTTAATSAPGTGFSLAGSATGHIDGVFYGPTAQNLGAVWSLSDGNASAIGTIAAH
jgi:hypothetical protein